jgi:hypothetical protein
MRDKNPILSGLNTPCPIDREPVRFVVISSPAGVREAIHQLHVLRFRDATTWSPLLPTPEPGIVMSINTHYRLRRSET